jgi:hypothetical protein
MGKIMSAIENIFFHDVGAKTPTSTSSVVPKRLPSMNERAYFIHRLDNRITAAHRAEEYMREKENQARYGAGYERSYYTDRVDYEEPLSELHLSTLKMLDLYPRLYEIDRRILMPSEGQNRLRSNLLVSTYPGNEEHAIQHIDKAVHTMQVHHDIKEDLTKSDPLLVNAVSASCDFLIRTGLFRGAPPRLTDLVMRRHDRVEDIISFVKLHCAAENAVHNIDLKHVEDYLDCPAPSLREGML